MRTLEEKDIEKQLGEPITELMLNNLTSKTYFNGEEIKVLDYVVWVSLLKSPESAELVRITKRHISLFNIINGFDKDRLIPTVKLKI